MEEGSKLPVPSCTCLGNGAEKQIPRTSLLQQNRVKMAAAQKENGNGDPWGVCGAVCQARGQRTQQLVGCGGVASYRALCSLLMVPLYPHSSAKQPSGHNEHLAA